MCVGLVLEGFIPLDHIPVLFRCKVGLYWRQGSRDGRSCSSPSNRATRSSHTCLAWQSERRFWSWSSSVLRWTLQPRGRIHPLWFAASALMALIRFLGQAASKIAQVVPYLIFVWCSTCDIFHTHTHTITCTYLSRKTQVKLLWNSIGFHIFFWNKVTINPQVLFRDTLFNSLHCILDEHILQRPGWRVGWSRQRGLQCWNVLE